MALAELLSRQNHTAFRMNQSTHSERTLNNGTAADPPRVLILFISSECSLALCEQTRMNARRTNGPACAERSHAPITLKGGLEETNDDGDDTDRRCSGGYF